MYLTRGYWSSTEIKQTLSNQYEHSSVSDILHLCVSYSEHIQLSRTSYIHNTVNYFMQSFAACP